jgi:hypothetical protein
MSYKTGSQFVWEKWIILIGLALVCASFAYITWWSFWQTREWFAFLDFEGNTYVSLALALIFQYGQGPVLFLRGLFVYRKIELEALLRRRTKGTAEYAAVEHELFIAKWSVWGLLALFAVFASVDAWTNRQQMYETLDAKRAVGIAITDDKYFFCSVIGIVAVFVEEGLGLAFSLASHTVNDIREIHGFKRVGWLDVFADNARNLLSGGSEHKKHGGGDHRPASQSYKPYQGGGNNPPRTQVAPSANLGFHTPTHHSSSYPASSPVYSQEEENYNSK